MTKYATVTWSVTVPIDLPEGVGLDEIDTFNPPAEIAGKANEIMAKAKENVDLNDGMITDIQ